MSGIYIHIPFCKQACNYCNFHFSTSSKKVDEMVLALSKELVLRKNEMQNQEIETIYFGGGTPSRLEITQLEKLLNTIFENYTISENPEITIETNPDDLTEKYCLDLKIIGFNRLSVGIQSFFDEDLKLMHRAHNAQEAKTALQFAKLYFNNISLDLIYGIPGMSNAKWKENINTALQFGVKHLSCYALTVEPKTQLKKLIENNIVQKPLDNVAEQHFHILTDLMKDNNFIHYELSNFGKQNFFSINNSNYWLDKKYIGIGPSAHSYNQKSRSWNIANNSNYIKSISSGILPSEIETLTNTNRYNEYIMTGLRTIWGVSLSKIEVDFGQKYLNYLYKEAKKHLENNLLKIENNVLYSTKKGKFLCDGIASDLFYIDQN